ncbi:translation factor [Glonium stellatum]|uniref:Threonylcarbamoyl-AMP synthase n=1 Tax=Glonium stellatum TaxID=574774 RepID=A0A8E2F0Y7_9PEZI|nr:translation factor [Glonium stellatum]
MAMNENEQPGAKLRTDILPIDPTKIGKIVLRDDPESPLGEWDVKLDVITTDLAHMQRAAAQLKSTDIPVAFPTETVYGLGADATRSTAVRGIFQAKQRPSDNPLIVHVCSIQQLKDILCSNGSHESIPPIYQPLVRKFWPGPLTIILPNPKESPLAPEVTAGLSTFGARMPRSLLALVLIKLAGVPLAAPSANASTRPSPTAAEHVKDDLDGRIEIILDGGPCDVGVESTVVDGLTNPPSILRPGGISIEQLRKCPGWENVVIGYQDVSEKGIRPRAPGMKYRHYSPKAPVILYEAGAKRPSADIVRGYAHRRQRLGIIRTKFWPPACGLPIHSTDMEGIARGLFSALRELDKYGVDAILVEGIDDDEGDSAAAVMNRLRKAAEVRV